MEKFADDISRDFDGKNARDCVRLSISF